MKATTKSWIFTLENNTVDYLTNFGELSEDILNWKVNEEKWSIGQCIDHLNVTNKQYFAIFEKVIEGNYQSHWMRKMPGATNFMGKMILDSVKPLNEKKVKTFAVFEPIQSNIGINVIEEFKKGQNSLQQYFERMDRLDAEKIIVSSPVNKYIVYTLAKAIDIVVVHEQRHFNQAKNVLQQYQKQ